MVRMKCIIAYDGTRFSGYQVQPNKRTVQEEIEAALKRIHKGQHIRIHASGRTDAGVHAQGQVIHFDTLLAIPPDRWKVALNANLPEDIVIKHAEQVEDSFHARFDAVKKEYRYVVHLSRERDVFQRNYAYHFPRQLDLEVMRQAAGYFIGTHDFTSFCSAKTEVEDKVRTIYELDCHIHGETLVFRYIGNGFLYNMVRILTGTLLKVGENKIPAEKIPELLKQRNREHIGDTVPGHGLFLWKVHYNN
ncbi:tRNA pseudouridine(38-40) synthase TruA [Bacillus tianshenii]|nr:tRNA pseudouridine(38-40) synthase TruA [Bacillus tianshenii]